MNIDLTDKNLTNTERREIERLLLREDSNLKDDLEQVWHLMDLVWDDFDCDNKKLNWNKVNQFYSHPVWLLNGIFIEQHDISMGHRHAISDWVIENNCSNIVDYGGGFGTLARMVAKKDININVDIYEPHPSEFGLKRAAEFDNINFVDKLGSKYDCLMSTDVLEHVPDPLSDFSEMVGSVKTGGYLIIANCFNPVIKCHLPQTFHLEYTFNVFAKMMGLKVVGDLEGSHATIFKKVKNKKLDWMYLRLYEKLSKSLYFMVGQPIAIIKTVLRPVKRLLKR